MERMERLFVDWKNKQSEESDIEYRQYGNPLVKKESFTPDGIIDVQNYGKKERILFIAKEANYGKVHPKTQFGETSNLFWLQAVANNLQKESMFSKRISMLSNAFLFDNYDDVNKDKDVLKYVAFMNLNKRSGESNCSWKTLSGYSNKYQLFIREEINLIRPELIICCSKGVFDITTGILSDNHISPKVVWIYHPSYFRISDKDLNKKLKDSLS